MVSIIIPTFNKLSRLKLMISSLENQIYKGDMEVIIVNNGSNDGTEAYLNKLKQSFQLRQLFQVKQVVTEQTGRSAARNVGIKLAEGDLVIFIDDDVLLCPEFIEEHVSLQKDPKVIHGRILSLFELKFFEDPTLGILYPNIPKMHTSIEQLKKICVTAEDIKANFQMKIRSKGRMTAFESVIEKVLESSNTQSDWIGFTGGNVSVPKCWIEDVGGFDEEFGRKWGCEDIELGYRLHHANYPFLYSHNAVNYHMMHYRMDYEKEHESVIDYFFEKHKDEKILHFQEFVEGRKKGMEFLKVLLSDFPHS